MNCSNHVINGMQTFKYCRQYSECHEVAPDTKVYSLDFLSCHLVGVMQRCDRCGDRLKTDAPTVIAPMTDMIVHVWRKIVLC